MMSRWIISVDQVLAGSAATVVLTTTRLSASPPPATGTRSMMPTTRARAPLACSISMSCPGTIRYPYGGVQDALSGWVGPAHLWPPVASRFGLIERLRMLFSTAPPEEPASAGVAL
jgi:hypothetical protein